MLAVIEQEQDPGASVGASQDERLAGRIRAMRLDREALISLGEVKPPRGLLRSALAEADDGLDRAVLAELAQGESATGIPVSSVVLPRDRLLDRLRDRPVQWLVGAAAAVLVAIGAGIFFMAQELDRRPAASVAAINSPNAPESPNGPNAPESLGPGAESALPAPSNQTADMAADMAAEMAADMAAAVAQAEAPTDTASIPGSVDVADADGLIGSDPFSGSDPLGGGATEGDRAGLSGPSFALLDDLDLAAEALRRGRLIVRVAHADPETAAAAVVGLTSGGPATALSWSVMGLDAAMPTGLGDGPSDPSRVFAAALLPPPPQPYPADWADPADSAGAGVALAGGVEAPGQSPKRPSPEPLAPTNTPTPTATAKPMARERLGVWVLSVEPTPTSLAAARLHLRRLGFRVEWLERIDGVEPADGGDPAPRGPRVMAPLVVESAV